MKNSIKLVTFSIGILSMGLSLSSCTKQKEMQQQIELLQTQHADFGKKIQALTNQVNSVTNDMNQVKQIFPQMTGVIEAQKGALDRLDSRVTEMESRSSKGKAAAGKMSNHSMQKKGKH